MNKPESRKNTDQRDALNESEKKASEQQPENYKEGKTEDKVVEVLPIDKKDTAIKGIDPK